MRNRTILTLAVVVAAALIATGCDGLLDEPALTDSQRASAFISEANADPRDPLDMQSHFHPTQVNEYTSMNQESYWSSSVFAVEDQTFSVNGLTGGGEVDTFPGTTSLSGTITSPNVAPTPITFGFLPDPENPDNRLIRVIIVQSLDFIENVR